MIAQFEQSLLEKEIGALLDYYQVDLSGLSVFIDEGFEWLVSQADKYKMAYIVNPVYTLDVRNDVPRRHGKKYSFEEADFIIHTLGEDEDFEDLYRKSDYMIKLDRNFMILGPYKKQKDFTMKDALRFDRIIESCFDDKCWYLRLPGDKLDLAEGGL